MKKILFPLLVVAMAAPLMLTSCKGSDDTPSVPSDLPIPPKAEEAIKIVLSPPATLPPAGSIIPRSFEKTETGKAILGLSQLAVKSKVDTKANEEVYYITGTCTKNGNVYTIMGSDGKTYKFEITVNGAQVQVKFVGADGKSLDLTGTIKAAITTNKFFTNLCRTWSIQKTRISIVADGVNAGAEWPGCDLNEILKFCSDYFKVEDQFEPGMKVTSVSVSSRGTYNLSFENKREFVGEWSSALSDGFNYLWQSEDMGFQLENGKAKFEFVADNNVTYCIMTLTAKIHDNNKVFDTNVFCTMKEK